MAQDFLDEKVYRIKNNRKLAIGYTTGSCAAAASKAALIMLITGGTVEDIKIIVPGGMELKLKVESVQRGANWVSCSIQKDSGDDPDVTNKIHIYSKVEDSGLINQNKENYEQDIRIDGGIGIGRVTKPGLDQPIGEPAINHVPRQMICKEVDLIRDEYEWNHQVKITIFAPEGIEVGKQTFNEKLGILGGISILGTSGIVEPMSEQALIDSIRIEIRQRLLEKPEHLFFTPGNYGADFCRNVYHLSMEPAIKVSNFIGEAVDEAVQNGCKNILFVGHIGKLVKISGGIMNLHSKNADCRMELLLAAAVRAGVQTHFLESLLNCNTTEEAVGLFIQENCLKDVMIQVLKQIEFYLGQRCNHQLCFGIVIFSSQYGELIQNKDAGWMMEMFR